MPDGGATVEHNITEAICSLQLVMQRPALLLCYRARLILYSQFLCRMSRRSKAATGFRVLEGEETRVIMFGFGHEHEELLYSSDVSGSNPFQDVRVRQAAAHAIDIASIDRVLFRGKIDGAPRNWFQQEFQVIQKPIQPVRPMTRSAPKALLAEAGYPMGLALA
jgi:peptide/nickel transport system substrate-binding protein